MEKGRLTVALGGDGGGDAVGGCGAGGGGGGIVTVYMCAFRRTLVVRKLVHVQAMNYYPSTLKAQKVKPVNVYLLYVNGSHYDVVVKK